MGLLQEKNEGLRKLLAGYGRLAVAFSGGVDSSFLLAAAAEVLGDQVLAVTAAPVFVPQRELEEAEAFCRERGIRQVVLPAGELNIDGVRHNPPDRCYHCKKEIFGRIRRAASEEGFRILAEGSNLDDTGDYRPGMRAVRELGVVSPLLEAGLTKAEIRELSRQMSLPTWEKPSFACLASRFVYGETITDEKLRMVDRAEQLMLDMGFRQRQTADQFPHFFQGSVMVMVFMAVTVMIVPVLRQRSLMRELFPFFRTVHQHMHAGTRKSHFFLLFCREDRSAREGAVQGLQHTVRFITQFQQRRREHISGGAHAAIQINHSHFRFNTSFMLPLRYPVRSIVT